jgi:nicotinamidase/pyrazinamidase
MVLDFAHTALIIVDMQNDFCPAREGNDGQGRPRGALAVNGGNGIAGPLNILAGRFAGNGGKVFASQDWHPEGHVSFAASHTGKKPGDMVELPVPAEAAQAFHRAYPGFPEEPPAVISQALWPVHCVQDTWGAAFHDELETGYIDTVIRKGWRKDVDSYSTFFENDRCTATELHGLLKNLSINTLVFGGIATDYCVFFSVMDSLRLGYKTFVALDAVAAVDFPPGQEAAAITAMKKAGAVFAGSADLGA